MYKLKGIKLGAVLLLLSSTVNADIIISNQVIPNEHIESITISLTTGDMFVNTSVEYDVAPSGGVTPPPADVVILSFDASSSTFVAGGTTTLSWTTRDAVSCATDGSSTGWLNQSISTAGFATITINTAGNYSFTLTCTGADSVDVQSFNVTVLKEPTPGSNACDSALLTGSTVSWSSLWDSEFPGPHFNQKMDTVPSRGYKAYKFNTGSAVKNGGLSSIGLTQTIGVRLGAISECPGDFVVSNDCKQKWGNGGGLAWATDGKAGACQLKLDTDYYFNLTFTSDGATPSTASCVGNCVVKLQHFSPK